MIFAASSAYPTVSIHAPARGATTRRKKHRRSRHSFNSRAREGRDVRRSLRLRAGEVSIHAPARGATELMMDWAIENAFQFTRPRGARHWKR